jgi:2-polyprenyl-3-methyl-5-hydroxy-6-metoxy-1,4-benzoquinol methylase
MGEQYTPGHSANATAFMAARSFSSHGEFIRPYIKPGITVLDCGCGPGAISVGLAEAVGPAGHVIGVDLGESQVQVAKARGNPNLSFQVASVYELPFEVIFCKILPAVTARECYGRSRRLSCLGLYEPLHLDGSHPKG